jgi:hypothetical protein
MIIETPSLQFVSVLPEPLSRSDCFYVWPEPPKPYVSQAFAKLHKEVLVDIYKVRSSISTQYRCLGPVRPRRRRGFVFKRMSLDEVNELIKERGGCFVVTDEPDFWQFDMASLVGHQHALQA